MPKCWSAAIPRHGCLMASAWVGIQDYARGHCFWMWVNQQPLLANEEGIRTCPKLGRSLSSGFVDLLSEDVLLSKRELTPLRHFGEAAPDRIKDDFRVGSQSRRLSANELC